MLLDKTNAATGTRPSGCIPQTRVRVEPVPYPYIFSTAAAKTNTVCSSSSPRSEGQRIADVVPTAGQSPFVALWRLRTYLRGERRRVIVLLQAARARALPPQIGPRQIESWRDDQRAPCLSSGHHRAATLIASGLRSAKSPRGRGKAGVSYRCVCIFRYVFVAAFCFRCFRK